MGYARHRLAEILLPLQSMASRWWTRHGRRAGPDSGLRYVGIRPTASQCNSSMAGRRAATHAGRGLRVIHTVDPSFQGRHAARLVISGRMADVCDELDRLAALESRAALATCSPH